MRRKKSAARLNLLKLTGAPHTGVKKVSGVRLVEDGYRECSESGVL